MLEDSLTFQLFSLAPLKGEEMKTWIPEKKPDQQPIQFWDRKYESLKSLEKSHAWPFKRLSSTRKFFRGDHWIVPELKQLITQTNHNKNLISTYGWYSSSIHS